jgi:hypothetical protein
MKLWQRNGIIFGGASFAVTLAVNMLIRFVRPSNHCAGGGPILLLTLVSTVLFVLLAGAAGWRTTRGGQRVGAASLAGLVTGAISGLAVIIYFSAFALPDAAAVIKCPQTPPGSTVEVFQIATIVLGVVIALVGLGIGAAAGAVGGSIGQQRDTA